MTAVVAPAPGSAARGTRTGRPVARRRGTSTAWPRSTNAEPTLRLSTIDDAEFARRVATTPDEQLAETMRGPLRGDILDEIFDRMRVRFRPCRAGGVDAVVAWNICGRPDGDCDHYRMAIRDGDLRVGEDGEEQPRTTLTLDSVSFLKLVSGNARGSALMLRGKLKPKGDIRLARSLEGMFVVPHAANASVHDPRARYGDT